MRFIILIFISVALFHVEIKAQCDIWVSECFINSATQGNLKRADRSCPIQSIKNPQSECKILTYGSEFRNLSTQKLEYSNIEVIQLMNVYQSINMNFFPHEYMDSIKALTIEFVRISDTVAHMKFANKDITTTENFFSSYDGRPICDFDSLREVIIEKVD